MRSFNFAKDLDIVNGWLEKRRRPSIKFHDIPKYGMIEDGVACGFLVTTDTTTCFLEAFISNPDAAWDLRDKALRRIARWAESLASCLGFSRCLFISENDDLSERAKDIGFEFKKVNLGVKNV